MVQIRAVITEPSKGLELSPIKLEYCDGSSWFSLATENYVNSKTWDINTATTGSLQIPRLAGYPNTALMFLNGLGNWVNPLTIVTNDPNNLTSGFTVKNTNPAAVSAGLSVDSNQTGTGVQFGFNNNTNEAYVWASGSAPLKFGTAGTLRMLLGNDGSLNLQDNNLITTGNINAQTGTLIANNLDCYNSIAIVCHAPLSIHDNGKYQPYSGSYGYLNASGKVGTSSGQYPYSINCDNRVKASEFNAVSSLKIKNIEGCHEDIEEEALAIFKKIPFFKYTYKDPERHGQGASFGVIAECLEKITPHYVSQDKSFIPNILQHCQVKKRSLHTYSLTFKDTLPQTSSKKLQLICSEKTQKVDIVWKKAKELMIKTEQEIPENAFAYGTYEACPSVVKNKLFELSMVVLKNALRRLDILEKQMAFFLAQKP